MTVTWIFDDGSISISKDPHYFNNEFSDCGCICRCLCVTRLDDAVYATPPPRTMTGIDCLEQLSIVGCGYKWTHGWSVTLTNPEDPYDTQDINFWLSYNCVTGLTYMNTSLSDVPIAITCPDIANLPGSGAPTTINWNIVPGGGQQPYLLQVKCVACETCSIGTVTSACCPYRELPATLTIEVVETNVDCVILLGSIGTLIWNGDEFDPIWTGILFGHEFILRCGGCDEIGSWCLTGCGPLILANSGSCSPFELNFCGGGGCASCNEPVTSEYCVLITE